MPIFSVKGLTPRVHPSAFIADGACVVGDVVLEEEVSVWFNAVIRADVSYISVGARSNVQDGCLVHCDHEQPTIIGRNVVIGHGAVVHAAKLEDDVLVGINAVILNRAVVGRGSIVGAGAVILEDMIVPPHSLVVGVPARVIKQLSAAEIARKGRGADLYVEKAKEYRRSGRQIPELYQA